MFANVWMYGRIFLNVGISESLVFVRLHACLYVYAPAELCIMYISHNRLITLYLP